jgi:hypothetical protein
MIVLLVQMPVSPDDALRSPGHGALQVFDFSFD